MDPTLVEWVPLIPCPDGVQEFAVIIKDQKLEYDQNLKNKGPYNWWVHPDDFRQHMLRYVEERGIGSVVTLLKISAGMRWKGTKFNNIIVSNVRLSEALKQKRSDSTFQETTTQSGTHWMKILPANVNDIDNPVNSFCIFRGRKWSFNNS